jgi:transposase-like protein
MEAIAAGVSTRKYHRTLDPLPGGIAEHATSSSAVSRRFVALSTQRMHEFLSRPLHELDIRVIFIDGKVFREHCLLRALGVDSEGTKHVLGVREGSTENARVATALLGDLVERGLITDRATLFVIDGAKALRRAIREV